MASRSIIWRFSFLDGARFLAVVATAIVLISLQHQLPTFVLPVLYPVLVAEYA